jgi:hypothetical protein
VRNLFIGLFVVIALAGCAAEQEQAQVETTETAAPSQTLTITWQRLVDDDGQTCDRCGSTQAEVRQAYEDLKVTLTAQGIDLVLEEKEISPAIAAEDLCQSNRIWIASQAIEDWLGAEAGTSPCPGCCERASGSDGQCRTLVYQGQAYEVVPSELIVKAANLAATAVRTESRCPGCPGDCSCRTGGSGCQGTCKGNCAHSSSGGPACKGAPSKGACQAPCGGASKGKCSGSARSGSSCKGACRATSSETGT